MIFPASANTDPSTPEKVQKLIEEMTVSYGSYGAAANDRIDTLLADLSSIDPSAGIRWTNIMDIWRSPDLGQPLNYDVLPDGLPDTDELGILEKQIAEMVRANKQVELLKTIPGVGDINAATIAAYTGDLDRFDGDFKRFASYVGIVPSVHNSNEAVHLGRITKHGPTELWTAFVQVALGMLRLTKQTSDWYLIKDYRRRKEDKGSGRAIIALSRKVARVVFAMLMKGEEFRPELMNREPRIQRTA